jgi:hypothetical protein
VRWWRAGGIALPCLFAAACSSPAPDPASRYERWLQAGHRHEVAAYVAHLRKERLDAIVPPQQLLRSGRRWRRCGVDEFAVPPRANWTAMTPTLQLLADLQARGLLTQATVASAWRSPAFNACEGGSSMSRHLHNNALDLDVAHGVDIGALCGYWRRHGMARRFGLGFYSTGAIHVDTSGFRTWGHDHHRATSLCAGEAMTTAAAQR